MIPDPFSSHLRDPMPNPGACPPEISVVIPTWNNAERLRATLESLGNCIVPGDCTWELVLVNNRCTDDTDTVANGCAGRLPLVYVHEPRPGPSRARNAGIRSAAGQLILFADDDMTVCPQWIGVFWQAFGAMPQGVFWGGPVDSEFEDAPPAPEVLAVSPPSVRGLDWGSAARELRPEEYFISNWACRRVDLLAVGGFDSGIGPDQRPDRVRVGEESDLMRRLMARGLRRWYLPEARVKHFVPGSKCTLQHIADRAEASGYVEGAWQLAAARGSWRSVAVRMRAWAKTSKWWTRWRLSMLFGDSGEVRAYVYWRASLGYRRAMEEESRIICPNGPQGTSHK